MICERFAYNNIGGNWFYKDGMLFKLKLTSSH